MIVTREEYKAAHDRIYGPYSPEILWKDKSGKVWRIPDMETSHLQACLPFMEARAYTFHNDAVTRMMLGGSDPILGPHGDMAQLSFDQEFDDLMRRDPLEWLRNSYPPYLAMKLELAKRAQPEYFEEDFDDDKYMDEVLADLEERDHQFGHPPHG